MSNTIYDVRIIGEYFDYMELEAFSQYPYRSNWRVLHIDGFEDARSIPANLGKEIQFFHYDIE
jgi:hypothetical protein